MAGRLKCIRIPREGLWKLLAPNGLEQTLKSLKRLGLLKDWKLENGSLTVWGEFTSLEAALEVAGQPAEIDLRGRLPLERPRDVELEGPTELHFAAGSYVDNRADYFRTAGQFCHTRRFRKLRRRTRSVWALHAEGFSFVEIAKKLRTSERRVRTAIKHARAAAGLPPVTSTLGRRRVT